MNNIIKSGDDYFIIEKIVPNATVSLPFTATLYQIYRVVYNVSSEHELYIDNERVDSLSPTFKQQLKYILGYEPTSKETKRKKIKLVFAGHYTSLIAIPKSSIISIPDILTEPKFLALELLSYGDDDIKNIRLYGNGNITFHSANGGLDDPIAMARYNKKTKKLTQINSSGEFSALMRILSGQL
ncbi:TPA: hypothetical protein OUG05_003365 [Morganella morganii]|nr:hypothetical protein [Morganella morganii]